MAMTNMSQRVTATLLTRRTDLEQIRSRINNNLIVGCFGSVGLCQLCTKLFCTQLTKAYGAETSCNQVVIDSATYLLKISLSL